MDYHVLLRKIKLTLLQTASSPPPPPVSLFINTFKMPSHQNNSTLSSYFIQFNYVCIKSIYIFIMHAYYSFYSTKYTDSCSLFSYHCMIEPRISTLNLDSTPSRARHATAAKHALTLSSPPPPHTTYLFNITINSAQPSLGMSTQSNTRTRVHMYTRARTHTHAHTHARTHTHTQAHTAAYWTDY